MSLRAGLFCTARLLLCLSDITDEGICHVSKAISLSPYSEVLDGQCPVSWQILLDPGAGRAGM